jgi:hypothetical protein
MGGVVPLEIGNVGSYSRRGYSIGWRAGPVELAAAIKPGQPAAIIANEAAIRVLAIPRARAPFLKQVSRNEGGQPPSLIRFWPFFEGRGMERRSGS